MAKSSLAKKLGGVKLERIKSAKVPLWRGPEVDGVTQSLLSRYICCPERFRLMVVDGLRPAPEFSQRMDYGTMWHTCEEHHDNNWQEELLKYCQVLVGKFPTQGPEIEKWYNVCKLQFAIYLEYWKEHADVKQRKVLLPETVFHVPYKLPSGRKVVLRGRWDSVDLIGKGKDAGIYLQENKTKGDINEQQLKTQLQFDLQVMFYLTALSEEFVLGTREGFPRGKLCGVRYNVVRRPLSGGVGSIRPHQATKNKEAESMEDFYERLAGIIRAQPETFFMRWRAEILTADIEKFKQQFLNPILEQLWDWWEWIGAECDNPWRVGNKLHYRYPFGVWNPMMEGRASEVDEYLATGSTAGLVKATTLFNELE